MNAKKVIRRAAALARFSTLSIEEFKKKEGPAANYQFYLSRKATEFKSLTK